MVVLVLLLNNRELKVQFQLFQVLQEQVVVEVQVLQVLEQVVLVDLAEVAQVVVIVDPVELETLLQ